LAVGDFVIVGGGEEYAGFTGQVKEIIPLGSPGHDTGNSTDDIVVDLSVMDYSDSMKAEITAFMSELGYEVSTYGDVSIDSVILAPGDLIRITGDERLQYEQALTESLESAGSVGDMLSTQHCNRLNAALIDRVEQNYADYTKSLENFGTSELIDMAAAIHAHSDAYSYMIAYRGYDERELSYYLQFESPLEIVADHWRERQSDLEDMTFALDFLNEPERRKLALEVYPLYAEKPKPSRYDTIVPEKEKTPIRQLYNKMSDEYDDFLADLKNKPPKEIVQASYEKVFKEDLLLTVENLMDRRDDWDEKANALLVLDRPLAHLYSCWLDTDVSYMDMLRDCVDYEADFLLSEQAKAHEKPAREKPQTPNKPEPQKPKQTYTLLGDLRETQAEVNARKAEKAAAPTTTKIKNTEVDL
jgi:hypothetical protein